MGEGTGSEKTGDGDTHPGATGMRLRTLKEPCYRLTFVSSQKLYVESLTSNVMVFGDGVFGT